MAHRRIYVHEDKSNNATDFFGDVYNDKNDSEVAKVLKDEFERQRLEKESKEYEEKIEKTFGGSTSPQLLLISRKIDLEDEISLYESNHMSRLAPIILFDIFICTFISLLIGVMFEAEDGIILFLSSIIGSVPLVCLIECIHNAYRLSKLRNELDSIERRISKR